MNIFQILGNLNNKKHQFFTEGSTEERKGIAPLVLMRWMTGTSNPMQIVSLNSTVNPYVFNLYQHPDLLMRLLASNGPGKFTKYNWIKVDGGKSSVKKATYELYHRAYQYSISEYRDIEDLIDVDSVVNLALDVGYQQDQINIILKEWGEKVPRTPSTRKTKTTSTPTTLQIDDSLFE